LILVLMVSLRWSKIDEGSDLGSTYPIGCSSLARRPVFFVMFVSLCLFGSLSFSFSFFVLSSGGSPPFRFFFLFYLSGRLGCRAFFFFGPGIC